MKHTFKTLVAFCLFGFGTSLYGQAIISTAGEYTESESYSVSWTIGESFVQEYITDNLHFQEGFQQSYISVSVHNELKELDMEIKAYPNPTRDNLILSLDEAEFTKEKLAYRLLDLNGKMLVHKDIQTSRTIISLENYNPSIYFIKVYKNQTELKTFKIVKQ